MFTHVTKTNKRGLVVDFLQITFGEFNLPDIF